MTSLEDQMNELRRALHDVAYEMFAALGIVRLTKRFGMKLRPWAREAQIRSRWRNR